MSEIILCNRTLGAEAFKRQCGTNIEGCSTSNCTKPPERAFAYRPYLLPNNESSLIGKYALSQLSSPLVSRELTNLSLSYGGNNLIALAGMSAKLEDFNVGLLGASISVYSNRIGRFVGSVKNYQKSLMEYRKALSSNTAIKNAAKQKAKMAFQTMQNQFGQELKTVSNRVKSRKGSPLVNVDRAFNIARSSRNTAKLNVTNQVQLNSIVKFAKHANFLGNGLAVIDFGTRAGNVHTNYKSGGNWERELFIESSSFTASALAGIATVNAGGAALGFLIVATPIGWVGLIVGGVAIAGAAAGASIFANGLTKNNSGQAYDIIMKQLKF